MHNLKLNGDYLAQEFARIINSNPNSKLSIKKQASDLNPSGTAPEGHADGADANSEASNIEDMMIDKVAPDDDQDYAADSLSEDIDSMGSFAGAINSEQSRILAGLRKISSSLRVKGEGFAADVVEAASTDILGDFKKESMQNEKIEAGLRKIASELVNSGDLFAADLVHATLNKIKA